ncbi:MAG: hypothetical protein MRZ75_10955 [Roseburia sp.]|nr:hypothetical protein [Roseburia sp.]MDD6215231.1 hypothetical protein [Roseburia sp.]MDY5882280.1 hypothetical protein [Roseburia sp.]
MSRKGNQIICNQCGRVICCQEEQNEKEFLSIEKTWGYFSSQKDGEIHTIDLCETCYGKWTKGFLLPPDKSEITEYL